MSPDGEVAPPFLAELEVPSASAEGKTYRMALTPAGSWVHADAGCEAAQHGKACSHGDRAQALWLALHADDPIPGARAVALRPLDMIQSVDLSRIIREVLPDPGRDHAGRHPWVYQFKSKGQDIIGLAADGIQDAARALAFEGETIRVLYAKIDHEDNDYAYFVAAAARYAISPAGQEICLDSTIRGKRQPKFQMVAEYKNNQKVGEHRQEIDAWWEDGLTKSTRNVIEALIPEKLKQEMMQRATGRGPALPAPAPTQQQRRAAPAPAASQAPPAQAPAAMEEPIDAEYHESGETTYAGLTYAEAKAHPAEHFRALNAFMTALGRRAVPAEMAALPMDEILRRLPAA